MESKDCSVLFAIASMEDKVQSWVAAAPPSWTWRNLPQARRRRTLLCRFASVKDMTLPQVRDFLKMQASLIVNADENAGKLMTSPALGASERLTIGEAQSLMIRYDSRPCPFLPTARSAA